MPQTLDEDALATLTPEERAAVEDPEYSDTQRATLEKLAAGAPDDDDDPADALPDGAVVDADGKVIEVAAPAAAPAAAAPVADAGPVVDDFTPPAIIPKLPDDYETRVKEVNDGLAAINQRFKDGEIDMDQADQERQQLQSQRDDLLVTRAKYETAVETQRQAAEQSFNSAALKLFSAVKAEAGIDYRTDQARFDSFNFYLKTLAANPSTGDKSPQWFLEQADTLTRAAFGDPPRGRASAPAPAPTAAPAPAPAASRKPATETLPKSLANVPGGDGPGDVGSEFEQVDSLDGYDLEGAIAKMSPAQRANYARGR